jgi:hypothetical protein
MGLWFIYGDALAFWCHWLATDRVAMSPKYRGVSRRPAGGARYHHNYGVFIFYSSVAVFRFDRLQCARWLSRFVPLPTPDVCRCALAVKQRFAPSLHPFPAGCGFARVLDRSLIRIVGTGARRRNSAKHGQPGGEICNASRKSNTTAEAKTTAGSEI